MSCWRFQNKYFDAENRINLKQKCVNKNKGMIRNFLCFVDFDFLSKYSN